MGREEFANNIDVSCNFGRGSWGRSERLSFENFELLWGGASIHFFPLIPRGYDRLESNIRRRNSKLRRGIKLGGKIHGGKGRRSSRLVR